MSELRARILEAYGVGAKAQAQKAEAAQNLAAKAEKKPPVKSKH